MSRAKWWWLIGAFVLCFLAGGVIWWRGSYPEYLDGSFHWETVPLLASVALFLSWVIGAGIVASALAPASAFTAVILARVVLDGMENSSNHNLWPFEMAVAFGFGMLMSFPAAALGGLIRRLRYRSRA